VHAELGDEYVAVTADLDDLVMEPGEGESLGLTGRELEVLALVADGLTDPQIAQRLVISEHTVHRHVSNILVKVSCSSRAAAVKRAAAAGLL
jgi:ATP/maltotriose-dependent transcriptional regulator MalT